MTKWLRKAAVLVGALALAACSTVNPAIPAGSAAYQMFPAVKTNAAIQDYRIGPLDTINITVFQEPDLTLQNVQVDASGNILLPLIGSITAAGKTTTELSHDIATRLGAKYLENPQVSVIVATSVSQKVTVDGSVTEPGVYAIQGRTTLLDALAMAKGTTRVAALDQVLIFREENGENMVARFNVQAIRHGEAPNPEIQGNDIIVVGFSNLKGFYRDVLTMAPLLAAFGNFTRYR
ncbi:MAG TPA: polysaccharide biosynthesis/export family protein [Sphingomonas sp.]|nr:polysaccharide biosynthesis/export family protein [Sphingomonas sp.]